MNNNSIFISALTKENIPFLTDEPLAKYSSFKIGGPADVLVTPGRLTDLPVILSLAGRYEIPLTVLGNCSNILVKDRGIRGVVLKVGGGPADVTVKDNLVTCEAGALLSTVAHEAAQAGLAGLEFAAGIPGSVGGGVYMNAGAYDGELKDIIAGVLSYGRGGEINSYAPDGLRFAYRRSLFSENREIIGRVTFALRPGDPADIAGRMADFNRRRRDKQPLDMPSAGSTFKRPPGGFAARLIDEAGLRGLTIGGAQVSEKHTGFIVNRNNASAGDILTLIDKVGQTVYERFGVRLEPEIKILGE